MKNSVPILYSFRRCPYAIRARMALAVSHQVIELREVDLKHKPAEMIALSAKATVPVLQLISGEIIEESLDIMQWALSIADPDNWLIDGVLTSANELILANDHDFKTCLDRYKYADRFPQFSMEHYRHLASAFPYRLDSLLQKNSFLLSDQPTLVDIAIFPFIRQFAFVDKNWFDEMHWNSLHQWLDYFLNSAYFLSVMNKFKPWDTGDLPVIIGPDWSN